MRLSRTGSQGRTSSSRIDLNVFSQDGLLRSSEIFTYGSSRVSRTKRLSILLTFNLIKFSTAILHRAACPYVPILSAHYKKSYHLISIPIMGTTLTYLVGCALLVVLNLSPHGILQIVLCLHLFSLSILLIWINSYFAFLIALLLMGCGKGLSDSAIQMSIRVFPNDYQGFATAVVETSWGMVSMVATPLVGIGLGVSFDLPFSSLAGIFVLLIPLTFLSLRGLKIPDEPLLTEPGTLIYESDPDTIEQKSRWCTLFTNPMAQITLMSGFTLRLSSDVMLITYGVWMKNIHGVSTLQLAYSTFAFGIADVLGEATDLYLLNRTQPIHFFYVGNFLSACLYLLLSFFTESNVLIWYPLGILVAIFIAFEATTVCCISTSSRVKGLEPGRLESVSMAIQALGAVMAAIFGPLLREQWGFQGCAYFSATLSAISFLFTFVCACCDKSGTTTITLS